MKKKLLVLLPSLVALMACGSTQPASSSAAPASSTPAQESSEPLSIKGYELSKLRDNTTNASYDLKTVIHLVSVKSITDLTFASSDPEVATVDAQGVITRVGYGISTITINLAKDPSYLTMSTFNISFDQEESKLLGKYDCHIDAPQGKEEVYAVMELKANKTFTLTYTAGTVIDHEDSYDIEALTADGTYTVDSLYKFTITTESFPYKKTFSGMMDYPEGKSPVLKLKVPLAADKLSKIHYFEKDE